MRLFLCFFAGSSECCLLSFAAAAAAAARKSAIIPWFKLRLRGTDFHAVPYSNEHLLILSFRFVFFHSLQARDQEANPAPEGDDDETARTTTTTTTTATVFNVTLTRNGGDLETGDEVGGDNSTTVHATVESLGEWVSSE